MSEWVVVKRTGADLSEQTLSVKADGSFGVKWERPEVLRLSYKEEGRRVIDEMQKSPFFSALKNVTDGR